uniref:Uncharacterized protein n=1 Tax=Oryza glumipatula TaxID=40148 RepID=A0A0D9ZI47_9ORYZ
MAHLHDADFRPEMFVPEGTNIEAPWEGGHQGRTSPFKVISRGLMRSLKTRAIIEQITNLCVEFVDWHYRDRVLGRVLVKARYKSANDVPSKQTR